MAKGRYQELYEARMNRLGKNINKSESLQNQIDNYKTKLAAGGADPTVDDRNTIEKLLNLDQDQGFIKDVFEILNRPQQAIFSGINAAQEGGSFLEGAAKGITGNDDETDFKKILMNTGAFEDEKGKLDAVDVLGFAGDVFLDPMNIPVGGFSKVGKALDAGESTFKALRNLDTVDDVLFKAAGKGIKKGAKIADTGIEAGLKYLDETKGVLDKSGNVVKINYANAGTKRASELMPINAETGKAFTEGKGLLQQYKGLKNQFSDTFKLPEQVVNATLNKRKIDAATESASMASKAEIKRKKDNASEFIDGLKDKNKYGDINNLLNNTAMMLRSTNNRTQDTVELIEKAKKGDLPGYEEVIDHFNAILDRDVPPTLIDQLKQKYGEDALSVTIDEHNNIKLGRGWEEVNIEKLDTNSINDELTRLRQRLYELNNYTPEKVMSEGLNPGLLEIEEAETIERIKELSNKLNSNSVRIKPRYNQEQLDTINEYARRYAYNEDGYRDFVDKTFGTAWKKQDSDIKTVISDHSDFGENIFDNSINPHSVPLSKNQALVMSPEEMFSGRSTNRDMLRPMKDGKLGTKAETVFFTDSPFMATGYGGDALATPENLGKTGGVTYRGLLSKTPEENVLAIGPNGAIDDVDGFLHSIDPDYDWTNVPYIDHDTFNTFSKITKSDRKELTKIFNNSKDEADFLKQLKKNKDLTNRLKSKYKIDVKSIDRPTTMGADVLVGQMSKNIDSDNLYNVMKNAEVFDLTFEDALNDIFRSNTRSTDNIAENIYKNQATGRNTKAYNTINFYGIKDSNAGTRMGDDIVTINPGNKAIDQRRFKALANKTPALESPSIFDIEENAKPVVKGGADVLNDIYDEILGTGIGTKYNYLKNSDYVAANILTEDGANIIDEFNKFTNKGIGKGDSRILSTRKYLTSPEETNNMIRDYLDTVDDKKLKDFPELLKFKHNKDAKFMETDYLTALTDRYVEEFPRLVGSTKTVSDTLLDSSFSNYDKIAKKQKQIENAIKTNGVANSKDLAEYNKLMENSVVKPLSSFDSTIPNGYTRMSNSDVEALIKKYTTTSRHIGNEKSAKQLNKLLSSVVANGGDVAINTDVLRILGVVSEQKNYNALSNLYKKYLDTFKMWKTASPTNTLNAVLGNTSNLMLGGVSMTDQAMYGPKVLDIMKNGEKYYLQRLSGAKLDDAANEIADNWYKYQELGFGNASLNLSELPSDIIDLVNKKKKLNGPKDYITKGLPTLFSSMNQKMDTVSRLTIMLKAQDDPTFLNKLGAKNTYEAISKIMFDPTMLTSTEKKIKNVLPFYTYAKNNLVYHVTNMPNNITKYKRLMRGMTDLQKAATGGNEENMESYLKDSLYIPIPMLDKDGNYKVIRANLPFGQVIENFNDPGRSFVNMLAPAFKAPVEYATGVDSFTGRPIENFPGEKSSQIPFLTKKQQKFLSDFSGLDVPLKTGYRLFTDPLSTVTMQKNIDTDKLSRQYDELEQLQTMMKQYQQEGYEFSTMNELKRANKNGVVGKYSSLFSKYGIE